MNRKASLLYLVMLGLIVSLSACGGSAVASEPTVPINPITISDDLTSIDLCQAIPQEDMETAMGVKLTAPPMHYAYREAEGTSGCYFEGPSSNYTKDKTYGYVILTPLEVYDNQPLFQNEEVSGIGDGAYFNRGLDTRQLWVKVNDKVAFVVAFGDEPNEEAAKAIAKLMVAAIK